MQRRELLAGLAAGATLGGCLSRGPPGDPRSTPEATATPTDREDDPEPRIRETRAETVATGCMDDGERVRASFSADRVRIEGVARTATPCHEAGVESAGIESGELIVEMGFEPTGEACVECVGAVTYGATVDLEGGVETVTVVHRPSGKRFRRRRGEGTPA